MEEIDRKLEEITIAIRTSTWLTPLNLSGERKRVLENPRYNPQIIYESYDTAALHVYLRYLDSLEVPVEQTLESWVRRRKIEELRLQIQLFLTKDTDEYSTVTSKLYCCNFSSQALEQARKDASSTLSFISNETRTPQEVVTGITEYLNTMSIRDWSVELSGDTDYYFRVRSNDKQILIGKRFNWDFCDFDNMLAHEIDAHVVRAVNASRQTNPLLQTKLPFYVKTEEGLASYLGDYHSTTAEVSRKHHALKYLGGDLARKESFARVYEFLTDSGFTPDLAFQRTFRLKRGVSDTSMPGLYAKEAMYYEGMLMVKEYIERGGSLEKLYSGKVGLDDLEFTEIPTKQLIPPRVKNM